MSQGSRECYYGHEAVKTQRVQRELANNFIEILYVAVNGACYA